MRSAEHEVASKRTKRLEMQFLSRYWVGPAAAALLAFGCSPGSSAVEGTKWQSVGRTVGGEYGGNDTMEVEFLKDRKAEFRLRFTSRKYTGTYSGSGNKLSMHLADRKGKPVNFDRVLIEGDRMTMQDPEGGELVFEKVK
jgi:hypothetical protein